VAPHQNPPQKGPSLRKKVYTAPPNKKKKGAPPPPPGRQLTSRAIIVSFRSLNELNRVCEVFVFAVGSPDRVKFVGAAFLRFMQQSRLFRKVITTTQWVQPEVHTGYFNYTQLSLS